MTWKKNKKTERKQRKKRLKDKLVETVNSIEYLEQQKKKINKLPLSNEERELQIRLIERSISMETKDKREIEKRIEVYSNL